MNGLRYNLKSLILSFSATNFSFFPCSGGLIRSRRSRAYELDILPYLLVAFLFTRALTLDDDKRNCDEEDAPD